MENKIKTAELIYELLIKMCKNNTENEVFAFHFLNFIQY